MVSWRCDWDAADESFVSEPCLRSTLLRVKFLLGFQHRKRTIGNVGNLSITGDVEALGVDRALPKRGAVGIRPVLRQRPVEFIRETREL